MSGTRRPQAGACPLDGRVGRHAGERMHSCATKPARLRPANWSLPSGDHWLRSHARAPRTVTRRGHDAPGHEPRQAPRGSWGTVVRQPPNRTDATILCPFVRNQRPRGARRQGSWSSVPMREARRLRCGNAACLPALQVPRRVQSSGAFPDAQRLSSAACGGRRPEHVGWNEWLGLIWEWRGR
jgi:hypothetical protein